MPANLENSSGHRTGKGQFSFQSQRKAMPGKEKESEVTQSCPTLCDPIDCSLPGSSIHGIFQTRILEWVTISFSRRSSQGYFCLSPAPAPSCDDPTFQNMTEYSVPNQSINLLFGSCMHAKCKLSPLFTFFF